MGSGDVVSSRCEADVNDGRECDGCVSTFVETVMLDRFVEVGDVFFGGVIRPFFGSIVGGVATRFLRPIVWWVFGLFIAPVLDPATCPLRYTCLVVVVGEILIIVVYLRL